MELSEEILRAVLASEESSQTRVDGQGDGRPPPPPVSLTVTATGEATSVTVLLPEEFGRLALRRAVVTPTGAASAASGRSSPGSSSS